jgi:hypothetical protein
MAAPLKKLAIFGGSNKVNFLFEASSALKTVFYGIDRIDKRLTVAAKRRCNLTIQFEAGRQDAEQSHQIKERI